MPYEEAADSPTIICLDTHANSAPFLQRLSLSDPFCVTRQSPAGARRPFSWHVRTSRAASLPACARAYPCCFGEARSEVKGMSKMAVGEKNVFTYHSSLVRSQSIGQEWSAMFNAVKLSNLKPKFDDIFMYRFPEVGSENRKQTNPETSLTISRTKAVRFDRWPSVQWLADLLHEHTHKLKTYSTERSWA